MCPCLLAGLCGTLSCSSCELFLLTQTGTGGGGGRSLRVRGLQHRNLARDLTEGLGLRGQLAWSLVVQLGRSGARAWVRPVLHGGEDRGLGDLSRGEELGMADLGLLERQKMTHCYHPLIIIINTSRIHWECLVCEVQQVMLNQHHAHGSKDTNAQKQKKTNDADVVKQWLLQRMSECDSARNLLAPNWVGSRHISNIPRNAKILSISIKKW